jgi:hypothetical protein
MTSGQLLKIVAGLGIMEEFESRVTFDPPTEKWVPELIGKTWPESSMSEGVTGATKFHGGIVKVQITDRYFRAIAKICFHYFLTQFTTFTGQEETFSEVRQFILEDSGDLRPARINRFISTRNSPLAVPMSNPSIRPNGWLGHLLCAEIRDGVCAAHYEPFISPQGRLRARTVHLGKCQSPQNDAVSAHLHIYYPDGKRGRYSGDALRFPQEWLNVSDSELVPEIVVSE